jgi:hypothetical protein
MDVRDWVVSIAVGREKCKQRNEFAPRSGTTLLKNQHFKIILRQILLLNTYHPAATFNPSYDHHH